jgi:hypothetical protein
MCTAGIYKGCGCNRNSKFSMDENLEQNMKCKTSCCSTTPDHWYKADWCAAHCGGVSSQFLLGVEGRRYGSGRLVTSGS